MIVAISYYGADKPLMERWAAHVKKLGPYPNHKIILLPAHNATTDGVIEPLQECFGSVEVRPCYHTQTGWPVSCNLAFENIARHAADNLKAPFLWMEPDAIPIQPQWLDSIEIAYKNCGQPFMGDFVGIAGIMPNGVDHMSGIAVYHWDLHRLAPSLFNNERFAWDIASAKQVIPLFARTSLIQHDWVPTKAWRRDKVDVSCVNSLAVIYHPDKLGVLFDDGLSPNDVQGDPAMGVPCEGSPHETKEKPSAGTQPAIDLAISNAINVLIFHAKQSRKAKKEITQRLCKENFFAKAKSSKQSRKKVRSALGKREGARVGSGVSVPSNEEVEGRLCASRQPHSHRD
jgi:hypothetical protein